MEDAVADEHSSLRDWRLTRLSYRPPGAGKAPGGGTVEHTVRRLRQERQRQLTVRSVTT